MAMPTVLEVIQEDAQYGNSVTLPELCFRTGLHKYDVEAEVARLIRAGEIIETGNEFEREFELKPESDS
jgi:hypothetical protein